MPDRGLNRLSGACCAAVSAAGSMFSIPLGHGYPVRTMSAVDAVNGSTTGIANAASGTQPGFGATPAMSRLLPAKFQPDSRPAHEPA